MADSLVDGHEAPPSPSQPSASNFGSASLTSRPANVPAPVPERRKTSVHRFRLYSSQLSANLINMDTIRTTMALPLLCQFSSSSLSRKQTSNRAADSVAEPRAVR
jgi:hypothetical protein